MSGSGEATARTGRLALVRESTVSVLHFALVVILVRWFDLENDVLQDLMVLALAGFLVWMMLPVRLRLIWFGVVSILGLVWIAGPLSALWILSIGAVLIGCCHLPVRLPLRAGLLCIVALVLAALRADVLIAPWPRSTWVILASMFMFRLIAYLYDTSHNVRGFKPAFAVAYFFPLPNACFALFPVLDYQRFVSRYLDEGTRVLHRRGLHWMGRGLLHLLLYRVVYYYWTIAPVEIVDAPTLVRYLVVGVLLYLRVGGQFHLIVGLLLMFGFNLPETNHLYFLATNFNDYWRRINIYWKDFMVKVFYLPLWQKCGRLGLGRRTALSMATLSVFAITWLLHSYQWFWLRGDFPLRGPDLVFWSAMGLLVLATSLVEASGKRRKRLRQPPLTPLRLLASTCAILATFTMVAILWSLWSAQSLAEWVQMWQVPGAALPAVAIAGGALGAIALRHRALDTGPDLRAIARKIPGSPPVWTVAALVFVTAITVPAVAGMFGSRTEAVLADLRTSHLNEVDRATMERGYYEQLQEAHRLESSLWLRFAVADVVEVTDESDLFVAREDFLWREIRPSVSGTYKGQPFSSNRWGMRDRHYHLERRPDTVRLAILGASHVMGHGVADEEVFPARLEEGLNASAAKPAGLTYEVLNFAVDDYTIPQQIVVLEQKVVRFQPDVVLYFAHSDEHLWVRKHLARVAVRGFEFPDPQLREIVEEADVLKGVPANLSESRRVERAMVQLRGSPANQALAWSYSQFAAIARKHGIRPLWVYLPKLWDHANPETPSHLMRVAERAGFEVITLRGVYPRERDELRVSSLDTHPNGRAHQLVADRLIKELQARPELLRPLQSTHEVD